MDERLNQWSSHPDPQDELANTYEQQQQQQYYTSAPPMAPNTFPIFGSLALPPSLPFRASAVKLESEQQLPSSSNILSFGGQHPSTLDFSGGDWLDGNGEGVQQALERRRSSRAPALSTQEHVIAERRRREKMQQQFVALATIVPDLTKTDKISILGSTIEYVKQLEDKVKTLKKDQSMRNTYGRTGSNNNASPSSRSAIGEGEFSPTVEASHREDIILVKIYCKDRKGVLVVVISEIENQGLSIINTSVLPFADSFLDITITAKIGEGLLTTDELVKNMITALTDFA